MLSSNTGAILPMGWVDIRLNLGSSAPVKAVPKLKNEFRKPIGLHEWWDVEPVYRFTPPHEAEKTYTRKDIVLTAANQDGGAHVDKRLNEFYVALSEGKFNLGINGENLKYDGPAPFDQSKTQYAQNFHYALIRQFAHEVTTSAHHFKWLGENHAATAAGSASSTT